MGATSITSDDEKEVLTEDVSGSETVEKKEETATMDTAKLEALKLKNKAKQNQEKEKMASKLVGQKTRSINFGIVGSGQAGSRLAESFARLGYPSVVMNTALVDLKHINDIPDSNKLLLDNGVGGASKELSIGESSAEQHKEAISELVHNKLGSSDVLFFCSSLGGGSGAGSVVPVLEVLSQTGKPVVALVVLPKNAEDVQTKQNSLETLEKLLGFVRGNKIANLLVIDNARLETLLSNVSMLDFFNVANKTIVNPIDAFNTLSSLPSPMKPLDQMEWTKVLLDGQGLSIYGEQTVENFEEETSIAESVISSTQENLLATGFDLKQAKYAGFIVSAPKSVWEKIPTVSIDYAESMIGDLAPGVKVFRGSYVVDDAPENVRILTFFSGLGLPEDRVNQLQKETAELQGKVQEKDQARNLSLQLDTGKNSVVSAAEKIKKQIAAKSSTFGKFAAGKVNDRRK